MKKEVSSETGKATLPEQEPPLTEVFIHNDDFTPMEFVVGILERFFHMDRRTATDVMLSAHMNGKALCGLFSRDCAETIVIQVIEFSRMHEFPLLCSM